MAEMIKIDASIEYEVIGDLTNQDPGDLYGSAVSLHGNMLVVGVSNGIVGHHALLWLTFILTLCLYLTRSQEN